MAPSPLPARARPEPRRPLRRPGGSRLNRASDPSRSGPCRAAAPGCADRWSAAPTPMAVRLSSGARPLQRAIRRRDHAARPSSTASRRPSAPSSTRPPTAQDQKSSLRRRRSDAVDRGQTWPVHRLRRRRLSRARTRPMFTLVQSRRINRHAFATCSAAWRWGWPAPRRPPGGVKPGYWETTSEVLSPIRSTSTERRCVTRGSGAQVHVLLHQPPLRLLVRRGCRRRGAADFQRPVHRAEVRLFGGRFRRRDLYRHNSRA